ncbi:MAG: hypothetical protein DMF94_06000 [Acidobacteria bacterium]|nr:MAG: hypothetical protein DMF94_06000 [Acidobacteriota bacterium]
MTVLLPLVVSLPCVYWMQGTETRATLAAAAIEQLCVAPERADAWRAAGFTVTPLSEAELASREALPSPGIAPRAGLASPTRSPWIVASGWRVTRHPGTKYVYDVPAGKAALAAAEAFAYGADAVLKIDPVDLGTLGRMLTFLAALPAVDLPTVSDVAIVDDGSGLTGEVMNLLARRNLLFQAVQAPSPRFPLNIRIGTPEYPREDAADPSGFALKIRGQLTDERRTLRVYGSEVVICRLTGDAGRARLHLINYGGREIEGLRIRLRGIYGGGEAHVAGVGRLSLEDQVVAGGATEFSVPRITTYAVIDLEASR